MYLGTQVHSESVSIARFHRIAFFSRMIQCFISSLSNGRLRANTFCFKFLKVKYSFFFCPSLHFQEMLASWPASETQALDRKNKSASFLQIKMRLETKVKGKNEFAA